MEVEYFRTEHMWEDVLNKPKLGKVFREFRVDLNVKADYDDKEKREITSDRVAGVIS